MHGGVVVEPSSGGADGCHSGSVVCVATRHVPRDRGRVSGSFVRSVKLRTGVGTFEVRVEESRTGTSEERVALRSTRVRGREWGRLLEEG
jgi:hypothetical protein